MPIVEWIFPGEEVADEFLCRIYARHPSLANDNLSGPVLWALLLREPEGRQLQNPHRFEITAETSGVIAGLARTCTERTPSGRRALQVLKAMRSEERRFSGPRPDDRPVSGSESKSCPSAPLSPGDENPG